MKSRQQPKKEQEKSENKSSHSILHTHSGEVGDNFANSLNEVYVIDTIDLNFVCLNKRAITKSGYSIEEASLLTPIHILPQMNDEQFRLLVSPLVDKLIPKIVIEALLQRRDGTQSNVEIQIQLTQFMGQECLELTILDTSEHKHSIYELERYKFATDNTTDAVYWVREDSSFFYVNNSACKMLGYSREQLLSMGVVDIDPKYPMDVWKKHWSNMKQKRFMSLETKHRTASGEFRFASMEVHFYEYYDEEFIVGTARDITDAKYTQMALQKTQAALDTATDVILWLQTDGKIIYVNDIAHNRLDYTRDEILEMNVADITPDIESAELFKSEIWPSLEAQKGMVFQFTFQRKDGSTFPAEMTTHLIEFSEEKFACSFVRDLTEINQAHLKLKELHELNQTMIELLSVTDGVWDWKVDTGEVWYAPGWRKMLGYAGDDIKGIPNTLEAFDSRIHPDDIKGVWATVQESFDSITGVSQEVNDKKLAEKHKESQEHHQSKITSIIKPFEHEFRLRTKDKSYIWVRARGMPRFDSAGNPVRLVGSTNDITEAKKSREAIEESEERFKQLANLNTPCWITEIDSNCTWLNQQWIDYTGQTLEEQLGFGWLDAVHPDDVDQTKTIYLEAVQNQQNFELEYRLRRYDGHYRVFRARGSVSRDRKGYFNGFTGFSIDIHDQREAQLALEREKEALAVSNKDLQEFAYVASHDLQEPLRKIMAFSELVKEESGEQLAEESQKYLETVIESAKRLKQLVSDLLTFSRISSRGKEFAPVNAKKCLDYALNNLEFAIQENDAQITSDELPVVLVDANQLTMLFQNLVSNAIKYRSDEKVKIHIGVHSINSVHKFYVQDNGIGIEPQYSKKIFEIFQRLHGRYACGGGTGIGLAICKRIIERFGGDIWMESEIGKGTTFYFTINND
ncbi:PAS domain S-box protein [Gimesia aquarii]|nr:PAS domain S-box protein [Gimesia aquarii]